MESSTNTEKRYAVPTIQSTPIYHDKGSEWTTVWFEKFAKLVRMLPESLFKKAMIEIVDNHAEYVPTFKTLQEVMHDYKIDDLENGKALSAALSKEISQEILGMKAVSSQCHATLVNTMAKCAKAMASADPEFKRNDECAKPNPVTTIIAMKRILITERDGKGTVRKLMTKATSIADFLATHQLVSEGLADFSERYVRKHKGLLQNYGLDVIGTIFADIPEYVLFWVFRLGSQYVQYQRDIENGIVQAPITLEEAVTAAKDRVEVTKKAHETVAPVSVFAAITGELPAKYGATRKSPPSKRNGNVRGSRGGAISIKRRNPLDPYPFMAHAEYSELSDADRAHVRDHNNAIREAMRSMDHGKEDRNSKTRVLATDADDLEELELDIVLMSYVADDTSDDGMDISSPVLFSAEVRHDNEVIATDSTTHDVRTEAYREYQSNGPTRIAPSRYMPKSPKYSTRYEQVYDGVTLRQQPEHFELCEVPRPTLKGDDTCWYIIGGLGSGRIVNDHAEIAGLTTPTYDYPRGHAEGFKSRESAEDWGRTVRKHLERLGLATEDCVLLAYKRGNIVKVQQYPHIQPLTRSDMDKTIPCIPHNGLAVIYDTLSSGEHIYNADASRMRTHEWNGGEIPTDPDQYDRLARQLRALVPYSDTESDEEPCIKGTIPITAPPELSGAMSGISLEARATTRGARRGEDLETPAAKDAHRVTNRYIAEQHHAHYEDCYSEDEDKRSPPSLVSSVDSDSDDEFEPLFAKPDLTYPVDTIGAIHSALHPIMTRSSTEAELDAIVNYEHPLNDDQLTAISAAHNALPGDVIEAHLNE